MKSIKVNSLPLKEVIIDIASAFKTVYSENCSEYMLYLPPHIGKGNIRGIDFEGGLGIIQYDCEFNMEIEIRFIVNEIHPLKFLYCSQGTLYHRFGDQEMVHDIEQHQNAIVASMKRNGHVLKFAPGMRVVVSSLEIDRRYFASKYACELQSMDPTLKRLFGDISARESFYHDGFYSLDLADSINEMRSFEDSDFLRKMFLESKAYQLLTRQLIEYQDDLRAIDHRKVLRHSEIRLIEQAAAILRDEIAQSHTVENIARRVGLNINKLQIGFQHLFHSTVNEYVQQVRLELSKEYLLNTNYSMAQIVSEIGLTSASYFSKIFKEVYGSAPSKFRGKYIEALKNRNLKRY